MGNYRSGVGQLVTSRYDFQNHIDGYAYQHLGGTITCSVIVDGTSYTDVQSALTAISGYIPATVPNATASITGGIKLTGDLGGTYSSPLVSRLQNTAILSTIPTSGKLFGYNGSGWGPVSLGGDISGSYGTVSVTKFQGRAFSSSAPSTNHLIYWNGTQWAPGYPVFGGDISGNSNDLDVVGVTGSGGVFDIKCRYLTFASSVVVPTINQVDTSIADGTNLFIRSQNSTVLAGGNVYLSSGSGDSPSNRHGHLYLQSGNHTVTMLHIGEPNNPTNYVLSLCGAATIVNMPVNTGNRVIYINNALVTPTASPTSGTILYSSNGKLYTRGTDSYNRKIASYETVYNNFTYADDTGDTGSVTSSSFSNIGVSVLITQGMHNGDIVKITFSGFFNYSGSFMGFIRCLFGGIAIPGFSEIQVASSVVTNNYISNSVMYTLTADTTTPTSITIQGRTAVGSGETLTLKKKWGFLIEVIKP